MPPYTARTMHPQAPISYSTGWPLCGLSNCHIQPEWLVLGLVHSPSVWPQPDILRPPLLRLRSRKPLWLDLQPVDIKSRWRHNWKSDQVVNSHLVCDPTIRQPGFDNSGLCWTVFARNRDTAVPAEGNGDLQTLICVLVVRPRRCLTLSNPIPWQNWMAAYLGYTLRMKTLFRGWPVMAHETHTRRRSPTLVWVLLWRIVGCMAECWFLTSDSYIVFMLIVFLF